MVRKSKQTYSMESEKTNKAADADNIEVCVMDSNGIHKGTGKEENGVYNPATEVHVPDVEVETTKKGKEKKEERKQVGPFEIYRYGDKLDYLLITIGTLAGMGLGVTFPLCLIVYGRVSSALIYHTNYINNATLGNNYTAGPDLERYANVFDAVQTELLYFCILGVTTLVLGYVAAAFWGVAAERQMKKIRRLFFAAILRQGIGWFDVHETGDLGTKFTEDMNALADGLGDKVAIFIQWVTTFFVGLIVALIYGWKLALSAIAFLPLILFAGAISAKAIQSAAVMELQAYGKAGSVAEEVLGAIRTVMAFNGQEKECQRYRDNLLTAHSVAIRRGLAMGLGFGSFFFFVFCAMSVCFYLGIHLVMWGEPGFDPGNTLTVFVSFMFASMSLANAFPSLESMANARAAAFKVFEIIEQPSVIDSSSTSGDKLEAVKGNLELRNVHFQYPARQDVTVLNDFNLEVNVGKTVALVGPSGCGKSTVIQLLQRFYDPQQGEIYMDGRNIRELNVKWLRQQIGVVSQEPVLFATTIADNIRYGRMDVTEQEIEQAAREANAHDFIMQLPKGYETLAGDRGTQMSGGQKQRIAIARALVRNPTILLLDEATSALDNESEAVVQRALEKAEEGRTTIVVAHRLSTIRNADVIIVIQDGKVSERGTHDTLMADEGLYYELVKQQVHHEQDHDDEEVVEELEHELLDLSDDSDEEEAMLKRTNSGRSRTGSFRRKKALQNTGLERAFSSESKKEEDSQEEVPSAPWKRILRMNAPEWPLIVIGCVSSILLGCMQPMFAIILSEFLNVFTAPIEEQERLSKMMVGFAIGLGVFNSTLRVACVISFSKAGANLTRRFRDLVFQAMVKQDIAYFDNPHNRIGTLTTRLSNDASQVQGATGTKIGLTIEAVAMVIAALIVAFTGTWKLTLVILIFMPLMGIMGMGQAKMQMGYGKGDKKSMDKAGQLTSEAIDNIRTVAALTREDTFLGIYDNIILNMERKGITRAQLIGLMQGFSQSIIFFAYAAAFGYGAYLVQYDAVPFQNVFRVYGAVVFAGMTIGRQSASAPDYQKGRMAAARMFATIDKTPTIDASSEEGTQLEKFSGEVEFSNVKFRYPSRTDVQVLKGLSLHIKPGKTLALVGASGCGKSTIVSLVERFYDPEEGSIRTDGHEIKSLNLKCLRSHIGIVSQEPVLFDTSIAENIAYGDNSRVVPMTEVVAAARSANIHSFIESLPKGYETNVGEKGTQLSGGQKQRVAIARALIANPSILLLDEATSALDAESEKIVQDALDRAREGRTCLVIAHRLSTIKNADSIAIIHKGEIMELGTHSELMTNRGIYYKLNQAHLQHKKH